MAWVRLHDGAMSDLKVSKLSDSAFRLWIRGLCYCQLALTDGLIPNEALRDMGAKKKDVDELATASVVGRSPLWEAIEAFGFKVHDYLDWNDSREKVQARTRAAKDRKNAFRTRSTTALEERVPIASRGLGLSSNTPILQERKNDPFTNELVTERAGRFVERYEALYLQHRNARYLVRPQRDYTSAVEVCNTWVDDARLDKLAAIFLTTDHQFAASGARNITQFASMASWCDGQLSAWESKNGGANGSH